MGDAASSSQETVEQARPSIEDETEADGIADDMADLQLDDEAKALLAELSSSQAEVQQMLALQRQQADELGGMRDNLANELHELQDEAWKLQLYGELEVLKRQLASLQSLEHDMDAAEAILDATEPGAVTSRQLPASAGEAGSSATTEEGAGDDDDADDDEEYDAEAITQMQVKLDEELAEMFEQLQAVKAEAAAASARKALLEAELRALLAQQLDGEEEEPVADGIQEA